MTIVCLKKLDSERYELIDCDTGEPIYLKKSGKKRKLSWYNICVREKLNNKEAKNIQEAASLCKGKKEEYVNKV